MKQFVFKYIALTSFLSAISFISVAQNVGGTKSNQSTPREVKAAELSKGAYTSDVNLFTGAMSTSYDLGSVSTLDGLSYKLQLNYSTNKTVGYGPSLTSGIPYGDGWNVNVPTISISTDAYKKYTTGYTDLGYSDSEAPFEHPIGYTLEEAKKEGSLYYYAPTISIPGVANGRFILKTVDTIHNELVFVPNIMEKYVEARLRYGSEWSVTNNNGDVYVFNIVSRGHRTPPQLNYVDENFNTNEMVMDKNLIPKEEALTWYCSVIYNKNSPADQRISFYYDNYGTFNFYKEFNQLAINESLGVKTGNVIGLPEFKSGRDILLKGVEAYSNTKGTIEKIELNYKTKYPSASEHKNMLLPNENSVIRIDSMYNSRIVFSEGLDDGQFNLDSTLLHSNAYNYWQANPALSFNSGINHISQNFNNWKRFLHVMSNDAIGTRAGNSRSSAFAEPSNPYLFKSGSERKYLFQNVSSDENISFNHGFLESPRIDYDIVPGDLYEVRTVIKDLNVTNNSNHIDLCNFDINIVSGNRTKSNNPNQYGNEAYEEPGNLVKEADFINGSRGNVLFTTFNNPVKWSSAANNIVGSTLPENHYRGDVVTSNLFQMPALPASFGGLNIQIGPANSDHDFSLDFQTPFFHLTTTGGGDGATYLPSAYFAYKYLQKISNNGNTYSNQYLLSPHKKPSHNFGIGAPWLMMNTIYSECFSQFSNQNAAHYRFWWRDMSTGQSDLAGVSAYPNVPTAADDNVKLSAVELVRYSKNPYMLESVKKYKYNGYGVAEGKTIYVYNNTHTAYTDTLTGGKYLVSQFNLSYDFRVDSIFQYFYGGGNIITQSDTCIDLVHYPAGSVVEIQKFLGKDFLGWQNVFLLSAVKQIPVNSVNKNSPTIFNIDEIPTTHFKYTKVNAQGLSSKHEVLHFANNVYLLDQITDQLGGVMKYEYYNINHSVMSQLYRDINYSIEPNANTYNLPPNKTYRLVMVVKQKQFFNNTTSTLPAKIWQYEYNPNECGVIAASYHNNTPEFGINSHFITKSINNEFGFKYTIVKYPKLLNSTTNVPYDKYTHFVSENNYLAFGKIKSVEKFDENNHIISKKEYEYKADMAYGNFLFSGAEVVSGYDNESRDEYTYAFENAANNAVTWDMKHRFTKFTKLTATDPDMAFLEMDDVFSFQSFQSVYPNSYFVRLSKETNTDYDWRNTRTGGDLLANPSFKGITLQDINSATPIDNSQNLRIVGEPSPELLSGTNSIRQGLIELNVAAGNSIGMTSTELSTITEYEYWDANNLGITNSDGFKYLMNTNSNMTDEIGLRYEPSWELFRTKTYSPHLPGAYNITENYYYYDLKQNINLVNPLYRYWKKFDALNFSLKNKVRNLVYQKRTTSKAVSSPEISKSEYYWYDVKTTTDEVFINDTLYVHGPKDNCDDPGNPTDPTNPTNPGCPSCPVIPGGNSSAPAQDGCIAVSADVHPNQLNPPSGYQVVQSGDRYWYCPIVDEGQANRERFFPSDLRTKLLLRRVEEQIDTVKTDETTPYYHPIARFYQIPIYDGGGHIEDYDYKLHPNYITRVKYKTLEHTPLGLVRKDENERGVQTKYYYHTLYSTTFIDPFLACNNGGGAFDLRNLGVPECITVGSNLSDSLQTCYRYNIDYSIDSIIDPNGMVLSYQYDAFGRMKKALRNGDVLSLNEYSQWMNDETLTFEQRAAQNYVESYILLNKGSNIAEHSRAYVDPLGRKYDVQTQITQDYTNQSYYDNQMVHSGLTTYDNWDRVEKQYKPFVYTNAGAPVPFAPRFNAPGTVYTQQKYEPNQRGRVLRASKFGENILTGHTANSTYQIISGLQLKIELGTYAPNYINELTGATTNSELQMQRYLKTASIDEDNKKTITYANAIGQKVITKTYANSTSQEVTAYFYDSQGNLRKVINPNLQSTTYEYNLNGNLYRKQSVDAGIVKYQYDISGNVVMEEDDNARHSVNEADNETYIRKYTYDPHGRMIKQERVTYNQTHNPLKYESDIAEYPLGTGTYLTYDYTYASTFDFLGGWKYNTCVPQCTTIWYNQNNYTDLYPTKAIEKEWIYHNPVASAGITQNHLKGRLSMNKSYTHSGVFSNYKAFSYNAEGLMEKELVQFDMPDASGTVLTSIINYPNYNLRNSLLKQEVDVDADGTPEMTYQYEYDGWNRLRTVYTKQGVANSAKIASYNYDDALGLVLQTKYFNPVDGCNQQVDTIDYTYDVRNRLTKLNSHLYTEKLFYDALKPQTANPLYGVMASYNYNGNINGTTHDYKLKNTSNYIATAGVMDSSTVYGYKYDGINRLIRSDASVLNVLTGPRSNYVPKLEYGDEEIQYDAIGNITHLKRGLYYNPEVATPANQHQNWYYSYLSGTNKLASIDSVNTTSLRNYAYDYNGSQSNQVVNNVQTTTSYMRSNLPDNVIIDHDITNTGDNTGLTYEYNANDDRVFKQKAIFRNIENIYYLRDASGKEIAEYNVTNNTWIHYIHGRERIAEIDNETIKYFNSDHLGSNRIQYSVANNCDRGDRVFSVENANDYFAFGKTLRSFNNTGKFGYQGSEKNSELSDNDYYTHFRSLNTDIARWGQVDPKFKHEESPYVSMGNNPVRYTDILGDEVNDWFKNLATGEVKWDPTTGKKGDEVSLRGSSDTWQNLGADGKSMNVQYAKHDYMMRNRPLATGALQSDYTFDGGAVGGVIAKNVLKPILSPVLKYFGIGSGASVEMTTVGRWMSKAEYATMQETGAMVEGAGGQTFVATGGQNAFNAAVKGSVYAEFKVPSSSLLQGGQSNWFKVIGPNSSKAMQKALEKQGGQMLPKIEDLSKILNVK